MGLRRTLEAWGMDSRGAEMVSYDELAESLLENLALLQALEPLAIDDPRLDAGKVTSQVWDAIGRLRVGKAQNRIVAGTKALPHLLPDLVPPMDRAYTRVFFHWHGPQFQNKPWEAFTDIYSRFVRVWLL